MYKFPLTFKLLLLDNGNEIIGILLDKIMISASNDRNVVVDDVTIILISLTEPTRKCLVNSGCTTENWWIKLDI
jgi:hypothetical protein